MYDFERNFSLGRRYFPGIYFKYFFPFFTHFLQFSYEMGENYLIVVILSKKRKISGPKQHEDEHVFCFVLILRAMQLF